MSVGDLWRTLWRDVTRFTESHSVPKFGVFLERCILAERLLCLDRFSGHAVRSRVCRPWPGRASCRVHGRHRQSPINAAALYFEGRSLGEEVGPNTLLVGDPVFYDPPEWYLGTRHTPQPKALSLLFERCWNLAKADRLRFFGGSGGGYAATLSGRTVPGATVIAFNPQTAVS